MAPRVFSGKSICINAEAALRIVPLTRSILEAFELAASRSFKVRIAALVRIRRRQQNEFRPESVLLLQMLPRCWLRIPGISQSVFSKFLHLHFWFLILCVPGSITRAVPPSGLILELVAQDRGFEMRRCGGGVNGAFRTEAPLIVSTPAPRLSQSGPTARLSECSLVLSGLMVPGWNNSA